MEQTPTEFADNLLSSPEKQFKPGTKVIGFSLSGCIFDIARGAIREEDVYRIYTSTSAETPEKMERVIAIYKKDAWDLSAPDMADKAETICRRLLAAGKIVQPSTEGKRMHSGRRHWTEINDTTTDAEIEDVLAAMRIRHSGFAGKISPDMLKTWKAPRE